LIVQNHAADGGFHVLLVKLDRLGVQNILVVEGVHQIDDAAVCRSLMGVRVSTSPISSAIRTSSVEAKVRPSPLAPGRALVR